MQQQKQTTKLDSVGIIFPMNLKIYTEIYLLFQENVSKHKQFQELNMNSFLLLIEYCFAQLIAFHRKEIESHILLCLR